MENFEHEVLYLEADVENDWLACQKELKQAQEDRQDVRECLRRMAWWKETFESVAGLVFLNRYQAVWAGPVTQPNSSGSFVSGS